LWTPWCSSGKSISQLLSKLREADQEQPSFQTTEGATMQIIVSTDSNIDGHERFSQWVETEVAQTLAQFETSITRVEVHLKDESAHAKSGDHIVCALEARPAGFPPVAVRHLAATPNEAVKGAAAKLRRTLDSTLGRLRAHNGGASDPTDDV
jgi:hypothetical protein